MSNSNPMHPITEDDIANYLVHNPDFFHRHAELLSTVRLSSPHGQRAVSLQERQAEMLRELGVRPTKTLPAAWAESARHDDSPDADAPATLPR